MKITIELTEAEILEVYQALRKLRFCKQLAPDLITTHWLAIKVAEAAQAQAADEGSHLTTPPASKLRHAGQARTPIERGF